MSKNRVIVEAVLVGRSHAAVAEQCGISEPPRGFEPRTYALRELGFPINLLNFHLDSLDTFEEF
jgi:hypothetical protein